MNIENGNNEPAMMAQRISEAMRRLGNPLTAMSPTVRADMSILIKAIAMQSEALRQHVAEVTRLKDEVRSANLTFMALSKCASFEIPYALVDSLKPTDQLQVSDIRRDDGTFIKRFTFKPGLDEEPNADEPNSTEPL